MVKHALWMVALVAMATVCVPWASSPMVAFAQGAEVTEGGATEDIVVLDSGKEVRGQIIEETATEIVMEVAFRGMSTRTTFLKNEVLEIRRDIAIMASGTSASTLTVDRTATPGVNNKKTTERPEWVNDDTSLLYIAELDGFIGRDISETPFEALFEDVDKQFDDLINVPGATDEKQVRIDRREKNIVVLKMDCRTDPRRGFDGIWAAEKLAPTIQRERAKGRRIVFWVENAGGGAAFLAFMGPEIYMMREGWMGGVGTLDDFDMGDHLVNEKQISLRLGHAEGLALYGGYGEVGVQIVRAMTRKQFWFAARLVGGKPEVILEDPREDSELHGAGWTILSDDGKGSNADDEDELKGNDVLVLEADWAQKLGMTQGVADDVDELAFALRIDRNFFELPETRSEKILEGWTEEIENVIDQIAPGSKGGPPRGDLWIKFDEVPKFATSTGQIFGQRIRILKRIHSLLGRYAEVLDPGAGQRGNIELQIEQLKQEAERERRKNATRGRRGGRGGPSPR